MNKKIGFMAVLAVVATMSACARADWTEKGTWAAGGSFMVDFDSYVGTDIKADFNLGNYIDRGLMVGGYLGFGDNDIVTSVALGAVGKWHFMDNGRNLFSPYLRGKVGIAYGETSIDDTYALVIGAGVGADYFVSRNVSINVGLNFDVATDDVYTDDKGLANTDIALTAGLGFFF